MKFAKPLAFLLILPIMAFSFEVEFNKNFTKKLPHDTLNAFLKVSISDDSEAKVSERLELFNEKIKSNNKVEKSLGSFTIRPEYKHSNSTPKIIAYIGELRYKVDSVKAKDIHDFISELTLLKKNRDTSVSVNNLSWSVKEETYKKTLDLLRLEAIVWGQGYAKTLSNDISKTCTLKTIVINNEEQYLQKTRNIMFSASSRSGNSIPVPEANQEKIKINPKYILDCE